MYLAINRAAHINNSLLFVMQKAFLDRAITSLSSKKYVARGFSVVLYTRTACFSALPNSVIFANRIVTDIYAVFQHRMI